jgi:hypothetical protein
MRRRRNDDPFLEDRERVIGSSLGGEQAIQ